MKTVWKPLTIQVFQDHLNGKIDLGVYCTNDRSECYWGCIDLDDARDWLVLSAAKEVQEAYKRAGVQSWVERSRSKGYHIWIFPISPTPARIMRQAQLTILEQVGIKGVEVNPKQERLWNLSKPKTSPNNRHFGIGNLVRIPYARIKPDNRMCFLHDSGRPLDLATWLPNALAARAAPGPLLALAAQQEDAQPTQRTGPAHAPAGAGGARQEAWNIWQGEREINAGERDNQFYTLARLMKANNVPYSSAYDMFVTIYKQKVIDKQGFSIDDALKKLERVYE